MYVQAGGGVVADSEPEAEYQETVNKARALMAAAEEAVRFASAARKRLSRRIILFGGQTRVALGLQPDRFRHRHQPHAVILGQPGRQHAQRHFMRMADGDGDARFARLGGELLQLCLDRLVRHHIVQEDVAARAFTPNMCATGTIWDPAMVRESKKNRCRAASISATGISDAASVENLLPS